LILRGIHAADGSLSSGDPPFSRPALGGDWQPVLRRLHIGETGRDFSAQISNPADSWTSPADAHQKGKGESCDCFWNCEWRIRQDLNLQPSDPKS